MALGSLRTHKTNWLRTDFLRYLRSCIISSIGSALWREKIVGLYYIIVQRDSTQSSLLFCKFNLHNSGVKPRPSPGVHKTVTTASGTVQLPPFVAKLGLAWPRWNYITVQRDATQSILYIILEVHSSCFVCQPHPLSGVHKTVTTASGTGHIICAATSLQRGQLGHAGGR